MSIDPSLKVRGALSRHRNVLTRAERVEKLKEEDRWEDGDSVLGLVKVSNRKIVAGKKDDKKEKEDDAAESEE
jgi:small basic protein (TIGR04137 family)